MGDKDKFLVILGNKTDLEEYREITTEEGKNYAKDINALFFEISTKTKKDIEEVFNIICEEYIEAHPEILNKDDENESKRKIIKIKEKKKEKRKGMEMWYF